MASIEDARSFWDTHPLWTGEAAAAEGSREFFQTHTDASLEMTGGALDVDAEPVAHEMEALVGPIPEREGRAGAEAASASAGQSSALKAMSPKFA